MQCLVRRASLPAIQPATISRVNITNQWRFSCGERRQPNKKNNLIATTRQTCLQCCLTNKTCWRSEYGKPIIYSQTRLR